MSHAPIFFDVITASTPRKAVALLRAARRRPGVLAAHFTFAGGGLHAPRRSGPGQALPIRSEGWGPGVDPRRVAILSRHQARPRHADAVEEHWQVRLRPVRSTGTLRGADPFEGLSAIAGTHHRPGVIVTYASVPPDMALPFLRRLGRAVTEQHGATGARASFALAGVRGLGFSGFTISAWRSLGDALRWVNTGDDHQAAMRWLEHRRERDRAGEEWFLRCVAERSEGTLAGRDPFADDLPLAPQA